VEVLRQIQAAYLQPRHPWAHAVADALAIDNEGQQA
jgi:hypothetical protein